MQEFQLKIEPLDNNNFAIALYQRNYKKAGEKSTPVLKQIGKVQGEALVLSRQLIYDILKANSYDPKTLNNKRQESYAIDENSGVTLAIMFKVIQPVARPECIASIVRSIAAMSTEEANYWYALMTNGKTNVLKAMRILFGM